MLIFNGHIWDVEGICQYCGMDKEQIFKSPGVECMKTIVRDLSDIIRVERA